MNNLPGSWECIDIVISQSKKCDADSKETDNETSINYTKMFSTVLPFHQCILEGIIYRMLHLRSIPFVYLHDLWIINFLLIILSFLDVLFMLTKNEFFIHGFHEMALDQYVPWICMFKKYSISVFPAFQQFLILL
jgi:hypothetical protein